MFVKGGNSNLPTERNQFEMTGKKIQSPKKKYTRDYDKTNIDEEKMIDNFQSIPKHSMLNNDDERMNNGQKSQLIFQGNIIYI